MALKNQIRKKNIATPDAVKSTFKPKPMIGEILVKEKVLTQEELAICLSQQDVLKRHGSFRKLGDLIITNRFSTRDRVEQAFSTREKNSSKVTVPQIPLSLCKKLNILVVNAVDEVLVVKASKTLTDLDKKTLIKASFMAGTKVKAVKVVACDSNQLLMELRSERHVTKESILTSLQRMNDEREGGSLLQVVIDQLLIDALQERTSDIHIKRMDDELYCWITFSINGSLEHRYLVPSHVIGPLVTRIKDQSGMDVSEYRHPQDGRFGFEYNKRNIDVRVAAMPSDGGEYLTLRLLDPNSLKSIHEMFGHFPKIHKYISAYVRKRSQTGGLILVTGPTGSGKTTALYAMISEMPRHALNILTIENPVEYRIPLITQVNTNTAIGLTFADILHSQLRHAPDVIVVGECRDSETAEAALKAVETGHFVLTTLHTVDAPQSIDRLISMLPDTYRDNGLTVLANNLNAVISQRLIPKLCSCAQPLDDEEIESFHNVIEAVGIYEIKGIQKRNPDGCEKCNGKGYDGRIAAPEVLTIPLDRQSRREVHELLKGETPRVNDLIHSESVTFTSREDSIRDLLQTGQIDFESSLQLLDVVVESSNG